MTSSGKSASASVAMPTSTSALHGLLGDLDRVALMQQQSHPRIPFGEALEDRGQDVARLGVRGGDGQRADILGLELGADLLEVVELLQARGARWRR